MKWFQERFLAMKSKATGIVVSAFLRTSLQFLLFIACLVVTRSVLYRHIQTKLQEDRLDVKAALQPFENLKTDDN